MLSSSDVYYVLIVVKGSDLDVVCGHCEYGPRRRMNLTLDVIATPSGCVTSSLTHGSIISERRSMIGSIPGQGEART